MFPISFCNILIFRVKALLTEAQNLQRGDEHPLPWYPPVCVPLMEIPEGRKETCDHVKSITYDERIRIPLKLVDSSMTEVYYMFYKYLNYTPFKALLSVSQFVCTLGLVQPQT